MMNASQKLLIPSGKAIRQDKLYLRLYHGRENPDQDMDDWGFNGPTSGRLLRSS